MSFQQGLSGLSAASKNLEVIGNNVANSNTYGEKSSRAEFADMYASAMVGSAGNNTQAGVGVQVATVAQQFSQGNITPTDNPLDMAINGNGFFQVQTSSGQTEYTRNGQFKLDTQGYVITDQGNKLLGYQADSAGNVTGGVAAPLKFPIGGVDPKPTSKIALEFNLPSSEGATKPADSPSIAYDDVKGKSWNSSTSASAFDAKGEEVGVTYYFQKTSTDHWDVYATANGATIGGTEADPKPIGSLEFSSDGATIVSPTDGKLSFDIPASRTSSGAATLPITGVSLDISGSTQWAAQDFSVSQNSQDGYAPGNLVGQSADNSGNIIAQYSNGQTRTVGQIELATFRNVQGLAPQGGNTWQATTASGAPARSVAGAGNMGKLESGSLEESNVDLTAELVKMMTAQRDYQANAQTIKTMDQTMQTLVNLR